MAETLSAVVRGTGPGIVLVHGAGGSAVGSWGPLLDPLAKSWSVVAPDNPEADRVYAKEQAARRAQDKIQPD